MSLSILEAYIIIRLKIYANLLTYIFKIKGSNLFLHLFLYFVSMYK